jgi:hypothetical protein
MPVFNYIFIWFIPTAWAQNPNSVQLLQNLPGITSGKVNSLSEYLAAIFPLFITVCAVAAVMIIAYNGLMYILSEVPGIKTETKGRMQAALGGLLLALVAWLILYSINPEIINTTF